MTPITPNPASATAAAATLASSADLSALNLSPPRIPNLNGKIAQLPPHQRLLINQMLDHAHPYPHIVLEMAKLGVSLNQQNISNWFQRGYQAYVHQQEWLDQMREVRENAGDLAPHTADLKFPQAVIHVGLCQIFQSLQKGKLDDDPVNHTRQLNALARLARTAAHLKKITDAEAIIAEQNRPLSEDEIREMILDKADDILGCKSYRRKPKLSESGRTPPLDHSISDAPVPIADTAPNLAGLKPIPPILPIIPIPASEATPTVQPEPGHHPSSTIHHPSPPPRENCPRCFTLLPPRLATGERTSEQCHRCGANVRLAGFPIEGCDHCQNLVPDLLPNGQRAHPDCPHCKKPLPPPLPPGTLP